MRGAQDMHEKMKIWIELNEPPPGLPLERGRGMKEEWPAAYPLPPARGRCPDEIGTEGVR